MNGKIGLINVNLAKNEYLETRKVKSAKVPNYFRVGNGTMNKQKIKSINLVKEATQMTKAEQLVINSIMDNVKWDNETGEVYLSLSSFLTPTNVKVFLKGFKLLKEKNLVKRTKQSHYMINPAALIPKDFTKALELWDKS